MVMFVSWSSNEFSNDEVGFSLHQVGVVGEISWANIEPAKVKNVMHNKGIFFVIQVVILYFVDELTFIFSTIYCLLHIRHILPENSCKPSSLVIASRCWRIHLGVQILRLLYLIP